MFPTWFSSFFLFIDLLLMIAIFRLGPRGSDHLQPSLTLQLEKFAPDRQLTMYNGNGNNSYRSYSNIFLSRRNIFSTDTTVDFVILDNWKLHLILRKPSTLSDSQLNMSRTRIGTTRSENYFSSVQSSSLSELFIYELYPCMENRLTNQYQSI